MLSRPLGCWLAGDSGGIALGSPEDGTPIDRNVSLILIFLGFAILAKRGVQWPKFFKENQWLCVFYLFWLLSILWSDYTFIAFKRWFRDAASVVMILVIFTEENPTEALRQVFLRCAYLLIPFSFLTMKFYLDIGRTYNPWTGEAVLCGVTMGKNQLGRLAMVSGLFLIWSLSLQEGPSLFSKIRERWFDAAVLVLCVMLLAQADSKTSLFCFGLGVCVFFAARMDWIKANGTRLVFWGGLLISLSVVFFSVPDLRGIVTGALHRNVNLTERTDVWAGCLGLDTNPLIGMGFASVWLTPAAIALGYKLQVEEAHNGYLETYLNGGLIGLCLLLFVLIVAGRYTVRKVLGDASLGPLYASLFLVGVIYNYTEAAFNNGNAVGFLLWILAIQYQAAKDEVPVEMSGEIDQDQPRSASSFGLLLTKDQHPGEDSGLTQEFTGLIQSISHRR
jgi:O-antigen ligase